MHNLTKIHYSCFSIRAGETPQMYFGKWTGKAGGIITKVNLIVYTMGKSYKK